MKSLIDDGPGPDHGHGSAAAGWLETTASRNNLSGRPSVGAPRMLICGDIGGTKVLLALAEFKDGAIHFRLQRRYMTKDYPGLDAMFADFMRIASDAALYPGDITGGCLAVAGPVAEHGRSAKLTNLPWEIDAAALAGAHGTGPIRLVNDFAAAAAGIDAMGPDSLVELQKGEVQQRGARLVIGAGTGLGTATLVWHGGTEGGYRPQPGEGGHMSFAPVDVIQDRLVGFLRESGQRATNEHMVSGPGLVNVYRFFLRGGKAGNADAGPEQIAQDALADPQSAAGLALDLFFRAYGQVAGDLALAVLARGGVYIAGGIAARILPQLQSSSFVAAFNDKAPQEALVRRFPIRVVTDLDLGLKGAARIAAGLPKAAQN